jgi:hypothetical protein
MGEVVPRLCPALLVSAQCDEAQCPYVHLSDFQITTSSLLFLDDLFASRPGPDERPAGAYERELLQGLRPVLCWVCRHPVDPGSGFHSACCDTFCCAACAARWPFQGHCPHCGEEGALAPLAPPKSDEVASRNAAILVAKVIPDLLL